LEKESLEKAKMEKESLIKRVWKKRVWRTKGNNGTHRTLGSAVDFGPGEEGPHLSSGTVRLRATYHRRISRPVPRHRTLEQRG